MATKKSTKRTASRQRQPRQPRRAPEVAAPRSPVGSILLATVGVGAIGVLGYFGYQAYKKHKTGKKSGGGSSAGSGSDSLDRELLQLTSKSDTTNSKRSGSGSGKSSGSSGAKKRSGNNSNSSTSAQDTTATTNTSDTSNNSSYSSEPTNGDFPLKKGSKNSTVRKLQQALISKYGKSILPKYGADGDFGSETAAALKKKGFPTVIDESTFNVIVQGSGDSNTGDDAAGLAGKLYTAASAKNFSSVLGLLKKIDGKDGYEQVSTAFKEHRLHGVHQTLVNGILNSFSSEDQKQQIRLEFIRMGLQYDGSKWSLSGFDGKAIVTTEAATVWVSGTEKLSVPANMVLGSEVGQRLDYTLFENNDKYFLIKTKSIKYL